MNINFLLKLKFPTRQQAFDKFASEVQQKKVLLNPQLTRVIKYQQKHKKQSRKLRTDHTNLKTHKFKTPIRRKYFQLSSLLKQMPDFGHSG